MECIFYFKKTNDLHNMLNTADKNTFDVAVFNNHGKEISLADFYQSSFQSPMYSLCPILIDSQFDCASFDEEFKNSPILGKYFNPNRGADFDSLKNVQLEDLKNGFDLFNIPTQNLYDKLSNF